MMSMPAFERSAKYYSARSGLVQLMSKERSGLPVMVMAVRHFVCVVVGAPGPVQGAAKAGDATKDAAPIAATAMEPDKQANASLCFDMELPPPPLKRANDLAQAKLRREKRRFVADN